MSSEGKLEEVERIQMEEVSNKGASNGTEANKTFIEKDDAEMKAEVEALNKTGDRKRFWSFISEKNFSLASRVNNGQTTVMEYILEHAINSEDLLSARLDQNVNSNPDVDRNCSASSVGVDYRLVTDKNEARQTLAVESLLRVRAGNLSRQKVMSDLFCHPLVATFVVQKWRRTQLFYVGHFLLCLLMVLLYSSVLMQMFYCNESADDDYYGRRRRRDVGGADDEEAFKLAYVKTNSSGFEPLHLTLADLVGNEPIYVKVGTSDEYEPYDDNDNTSDKLYDDDEYTGGFDYSDSNSSYDDSNLSIEPYDYEHAVNAPAFFETNACSERGRPDDLSKLSASSFLAVFVCFAIVTVLLTLVELAQAVVLRWVKVKHMETYISWVTLFSAYFTMGFKAGLLHVEDPDGEGAELYSGVIRGLSAVGIGAGWVMVFFMVGRLPFRSAEFIVMYYLIIKKTFQYMLLIILVLVGFAFSFFVIHYGNSSHTLGNPMKSFVLAVSVVLGDLDYKNYYNKFADYDQAQIISLLFLTGLIFFGTITMMNLFIVVVITDMDKMKRNVFHQGVLNMAHYVVFFEAVLPRSRTALETSLEFCVHDTCPKAACSSAVKLPKRFKFIRNKLKEYIK